MHLSTPHQAETDLSALLAHPARWLLATRPAFLTLTLGGVLLGLAMAGPQALVQGWPQALLALLLALLCHAAVNVINDVADHDNGSDAANLQREYPFTGGSRFIQAGVLSRRQMAWLAGALFTLVSAGGLWLVWQAGTGLFYTGLAGVVLGWGYSAPPLRLNSRGLGELTVALCFALLPLGVLQVLQAPWPAGLPWLAAGYGVAAALLLFANQFPDRDADALTGKRHWVVRLGHPAAVRGYLLLAGLALALPLAAGQPWQLCLLPLYLRAWRALQQRQLRAAIIPTIMAANLYPLLLAASLWLRPTL